jgi:hypothetical protein
VHGREFLLPICIVQILLNLETRNGNALNIFKGLKPVGLTYTSGEGGGGWTMQFVCTNYLFFSCFDVCALLLHKRIVFVHQHLTKLIRTLFSATKV